MESRLNALSPQALVVQREVGYQPLGVVRLEATVFSRRSTAMATPVLPTPGPFRPGRQPSM